MRGADATLTFSASLSDARTDGEPVSVKHQLQVASANDRAERSDGASAITHRDALICAAPFSHTRYTITCAARADEKCITSGFTSCSKSAYFILISS